MPSRMGKKKKPKMKARAAETIEVRDHSPGKEKQVEVVVPTIKEKGTPPALPAIRRKNLPKVKIQEAEGLAPVNGMKILRVHFKEKFRPQLVNQVLMIKGTGTGHNV